MADLSKDSLLGKLEALVWLSPPRLRKTWLALERDHVQFEVMVMHLV